MTTTVSRLLLALALWLVAVAGLALPAAQAQSEQAVPALRVRVTDKTGTLTAQQIEDLSAKLAGIEQRKGSQVAILMVASTKPDTIEEYSIRVAQVWKLGRGKVDGKAVDDGVLVVVAKDDHKVRIEVGYGLEGALSDYIAKRIVTEAITPAFRKGDFAGGLAAAVDEIGRVIDGEELPPAWQPGHGSVPDGDAMGDWATGLVAVLILGFMAIAILGRVFGALLGGAFGAGCAAWLGASLWLAGAAGVLGFLLFLVFGSTTSSVASTPSGRHGGRSGSGGSGWGGGSSGSDSFGGGGGGFGGGGASGDW